MPLQFQGAGRFNQDISDWNVRDVDSFNEMFDGANSFNQSLCDWRSKVRDDASFDNMFRNSACLETDDPVPPLGPFCHSCRKCFETTEELYVAVDAYLVDSTESTAVASEYGWPISKWCVSMLTDFSNAFAADRNGALENFNEDLLDWDVSNGMNFDEMVCFCDLFPC